jgi:hypothetical protein
MLKLSGSFLATGLLLACATAASSQQVNDRRPGHPRPPAVAPHAVPEIDAASGLAAVAAVPVSLMLVRERRRS